MNKNAVKKYLIISAILLGYAGGYAQEKTVQAFSLKEAIDYAMQNNVSVKNAELDKAKAKAFNWEILTQGLPQVSGSANYSYYFKTGSIPAFEADFQPFLTALNLPPNENINFSLYLPQNLSAGFQVNQLLFDARYMFGIQARKDLYKTSRLQKDLTAQDIRVAISKAYNQAEAAQESQSLLKQNLDLISKLLDETKKTFEQGLVEELDVNRLELAQATLQSQVITQSKLAEVGVANLKFQMGLALDQPIILTDKLDTLQSGLILSTETAFNPQNRIEYDLLHTAVVLNGFNVAQKKSGYYPSLSAFLNYNWNVQTQSFGDMFHADQWYPLGYVGITLNVPIFDSGLKWAQVKQLKIEQQKSQNNFENFKNAAELQYEVAQANFNAALSDVAISDKTIDLSKKIFDKNEIKFKTGVGSSFELVQSQQDYSANLLKHIQSVINLLNAKVDLDKALGTK